MLPLHSFTSEAGPSVTLKGTTFSVPHLGDNLRFTYFISDRLKPQEIRLQIPNETSSSNLMGSFGDGSKISLSFANLPNPNQKIVANVRVIDALEVGMLLKFMLLLVLLRHLVCMLRVPPSQSLQSFTVLLQRSCPRQLLLQHTAPVRWIYIITMYWHFSFLQASCYRCCNWNTLVCNGPANLVLRVLRTLRKWRRPPT